MSRTEQTFRLSLSTTLHHGFLTFINISGFSLPCETELMLWKNCVSVKVLYGAQKFQDDRMSRIAAKSNNTEYIRAEVEWGIFQVQQMHISQPQTIAILPVTVGKCISQKRFISEEIQTRPEMRVHLNRVYLNCCLNMDVAILMSNVSRFQKSMCEQIFFVVTKIFIFSRTFVFLSGVSCNFIENRRGVNI